MKKNKIVWLIAAINLAFNMVSCAQNKSKHFKEITIAEYRTNDSTKQLKVILTNYIKINSDGQCRDLSNEFNGINFSGYRKDTTFKLSDSLMVILNNFFAGKESLSTHIRTDKLQDGVGYSAPYQYIYYRTKNNKIDSSISISSNNDEELSAIFSAIWHLPFPKRTYTGKIFHDQLLENKIIAYRKKVKNLPAITSPTTVKSLR